MSASRSVLVRSYVNSASCSPASWVIVIPFQARTRHLIVAARVRHLEGHQARPEWAKWGTDGTGSIGELGAERLERELPQAPADVQDPGMPANFVICETADVPERRATPLPQPESLPLGS